MNEAFAEQALPAWRRAVLKVGSSLLSAADGTLSDRCARGLAAFIAAARLQGREVVLVSSGAVAAGRAHVPASARQANGLVLRQALAALGQTRMVALWQGLLDVPVAQVLLTHDDLRNRRRYLNARNTLLELLRLGAVPVVNENDTVAVEELKLGDNDNLAATVAALVDAECLLIASDVQGLYSADPQRDPAARPIDVVDSIGDDILAMAGEAGSSLGTGGMRTKLEAAGKAANAGIATVLFNGSDAQVVSGQDSGVAVAKRARLMRSALQCGCSLAIRAATPLACGAAIDVPLADRYSPFGQVDQTRAPGAATLIRDAE